MNGEHRSIRAKRLEEAGNEELAEEGRDTHIGKVACSPKSAQ